MKGLGGDEDEQQRTMMETVVVEIERRGNGGDEQQSFGGSARPVFWFCKSTCFFLSLITSNRVLGVCNRVEGGEQS